MNKTLLNLEGGWVFYLTLMSSRDYSSIISANGKQN